MVRKIVVIKMKDGLHARAAALFVQEANRFNCDVFIEMDDKVVNAKSIMGIMSLAVHVNAEVTLVADGNDELEAVNKLQEILEKE